MTIYELPISRCNEHLKLSYCSLFVLFYILSSVKKINQRLFFNKIFTHRAENINKRSRLKTNSTMHHIRRNIKSITRSKHFFAAIYLNFKLPTLHMTDL